jgi:hypothetical protein
MVQNSSNVLVLLLLIVIAVLATGLFSVILNMPAIRFTGAATGVTNLTISSLASIRMVRNISQFGTGTPLASQTLNLYSNTTNVNSFNNGSEGNGTNYGTGTYVYPFVVENDGNDDTTCVKISGTAAAGFIGGTSPVFEFAAKNNETGSCATGLHAEWQTVSGTATNACEALHTETGGGGANTVRVHWHIGIPYDAEGFKTNSITIDGSGSC